MCSKWCFGQVSSPKPYMHFSSPSCVPHPNRQRPQHPNMQYAKSVPNFRTRSVLKQVQPGQKNNTYSFTYSGETASCFFIGYWPVTVQTESRAMPLLFLYACPNGSLAGYVPGPFTPGSLTLQQKKRPLPGELAPDHTQQMTSSGTSPLTVNKSAFHINQYYFYVELYYHT